MKFLTDYTKAIAILEDSTGYSVLIVVDAFDGILLRSYLENSGTSKIRFRKHSIIVDSSDNLYGTYQNKQWKIWSHEVKSN